jgi:hypothetical protein
MPQVFLLTSDAAIWLMLPFLETHALSGERCVKSETFGSRRALRHRDSARSVGLPYGGPGHDDSAEREAHQEEFLKLQRGGSRAPAWAVEGRWTGFASFGTSTDRTTHITGAARSGGSRPPWRAAAGCFDVPDHPPDQGKLHDVLGRAVHLPCSGRRVLRQDQSRTLLCDR